MSRIAQIVALALTVAAPAMPLRAQDPVDYLRPSDPGLAQAVAMAQETLPIFLAHVFDRSGEGIDGSRIMILIGEGPEREPIWVAPFYRLDAMNFEGHIEGLPTRLEGFMVGQKVAFHQYRIIDWRIDLDDGKRYGSYVERAGMTDTPASEGATTGHPLSETPVPSAWLR
ncbi:hypothetical protein ATO6_18175 [Oceanicola sp. 22II-s10i]|uniref:DUF2314 domain-containing protein n=1 Tax=Oceanicola sp. 22II-s10i TaxID=1317116 RepID=UPI000B51FBF5|nr:DUF2314 domain-containing protein [Oceanicola sp. 22II-s10i]OWU83389.1 hypothetical protein ATO6_18175 [Oceanicola sp. 22II-s10i]